MDKSNLSEKEKEKAKQNGFILAGKTGAGKTTLLNAVFGKEVGLAKRSLEAVTTNSSIYYCRLENGNCVSLVDTPGLSDTNRTENKDIDNIHLEEIQKVISEQKIHIKGILFLVNFQNERFDADEQDALLNYNRVFPLRRFWKNLIVIFTHHFADPDGDDEDEMKRNRDKSNGDIFSKIMDKVKDVSDVIDYNNLKIRYFNSYSPVKNEKQRKKNIKVRDDLEILLNELSKNEPLFNQIEIMHIKNYKIQENGKEYLAEVEIIGYFDLNHEPLKETIKVLNREEITTQDEDEIPPTEVNIDVYNAKKNEDNNNLEINKEEGTKENSNYVNNYTGTKIGAGVVGTAAGIGGAVLAGIAGFGALPIIGVGAGVAVIGAGIGAAIGSLFD